MYYIPYGKIKSFLGINLYIYIMNIINNKKEYKYLKRNDIINYTGPINIDIYSIIYGLLLSNKHKVKRNKDKGTRIILYQENRHEEYLIYLHNIIANLGYCKTKKPKIKTKLSINGKLKKYIKFSTWTYTKFNYLYNEWYNENNNKKVPLSLNKYFTSLSLAILIMDDSYKLNKGLILCTNSFSYEDNLFLSNFLFNKFKLNNSIFKISTNNQYFIYISKDSMPLLISIVKPYIIPSMKYKIIF